MNFSFSSKYIYQARTCLPKVIVWVERISNLITKSDKQRKEQRQIYL